MGLVSSAQMVKYLSITARPTTARFIFTVKQHLELSLAECLLIHFSYGKWSLNKFIQLYLLVGDSEPKAKEGVGSCTC
ncbi:unnamed protein product [Victoria cruziana]